MLNRKQIKQWVIDILWEELIKKINNVWKTTQFSIVDSKYWDYITFWTDTTDGFNIGISINSYESVCRDFTDLYYDEYEKLAKAIDFITNNFSTPNWEIRSWLFKYIEEDMYYVTFILD